MRDFWVKNISEHIWKHKGRLITSSRSLLFFLTTLTDWVQWKKWNHIFEEFWLSLMKYLTHERVSYMDWLFCTNHHNIRFNICFPCLHGLVGFLLKTSKYLCLYYILAGFPFFQILSDYLTPSFSWSSSGETTAILEVSICTWPSTLSHSF